MAGKYKFQVQKFKNNPCKKVIPEVEPIEPWGKSRNTKSLWWFRYEPKSWIGSRRDYVQKELKLNKSTWEVGSWKLNFVKSLHN